MSVAAHLVGLSAVMFTAMEHLVFASGTVTVASKIRGVAVAWKLVRLWEARPNVASRGLSREWHLPLSILLHFLEFTFNNNGLVDHVLEINVINVEQLELNIIVQSF
jgi:hypothetical protein